jgi:hypothetical protein
VKGQSVPLGRYFLVVGGVLLALLFVADWYLPGPPAMPIYGRPIDSAILHIRSEQKWPQRLQFDTSMPTILPSPPAVAAMPIQDSRLDALAEVKPPDKQVMEKPATAKPKSRIATRHRRRAPAEATQFAINPAPSNWTLSWQQRSWY